MRAIRIDQHGGPEVLQTVQLPTPQPGPGQVAVHVTHVGLNHLDLWVRRGVPGHAFPLPLVPGSDVVGDCPALGGRVALQPGYGCMVCAACLRGEHALCRKYIIRGERGDGGMAEVVVVPHSHLLRVPDGLSSEQAAALPLALLTAWHMVVSRARVRPGDRVVVQAGASGTGACAIQIARLLGARVMATASSEAKRQAAVALGADDAVAYDDLVSAVKDWTAKAGADVVVDHVGADTWAASQRCLRWGGTYVTCGATTGHSVPLDLRATFFKQIAILGSTMGGMGELHDAWTAVADGRIQPVLDRVVPMSRLGEAHALLEDRAIIGKIVVAQDPVLVMLMWLLCAPLLAAWEPPEDVAEPFNAGVIALQGGDPAQAEGHFRQALDSEPACGRCAHGLGLSLVRQQRLGEARKILGQAADAFPERSELATALAGAAFAAQDFDAALTHSQRAAKLDPSSIDGHVALVQVLLRLGRTDAASTAVAAASLPGPDRTCLQALVAFEAGVAVGDTNMAYCRQATHPGLASTVQARLAATQGRLAATAAAAETVGADSLAKVARALRLHQLGRDAEALPLLDATLAAEPRRVDARILRALARARTGNDDGALDDLGHVFDSKAWIEVHRTGEMSGVLTASDEDALRTSVRQGAGLLVSLLVEAGRLAEAEETLSTAGAELGMGVELTAGAARLRTAQDRLPDAWEILSNGLALWPEDGDLRLIAAELSARDATLVPAHLTQVVSATKDWRVAYHLAVAAGRTGDHDACTTRAAAAAAGMSSANPPAPLDDRVTVARLWHTCAVNAERHAEAERAADALGGPAAMNEVARINHALLRHQGGDHAGAIALLAGLEPSTASRRELVDAILDQAGQAM